MGKMSRKNFCLTIAFFILLPIFLITTPLTAAETSPQSAASLQNSDCIKCHQTEVEDINAQGARHQTAVTCLDCHIEHPPSGKNAIPLCATCHNPENKEHFRVNNCGACHHPHHPLQMDITGDDPGIKAVCLSCHGQQGEEMKGYPSKHAALACGECHPKHATFKPCLECHEPHSQEMVYQDCLRCHRPHMPTLVKYDRDIPSNYCGSCHEKELQLLVNNQSKHHALLCVYCHKAQHRQVPECTTCHGEPHGADMHKKFPDCLACHVDAHDITKD